jgi:hypothetical protein
MHHGAKFQQREGLTAAAYAILPEKDWAPRSHPHDQCDPQHQGRYQHQQRKTRAEIKKAFVF